MCSWIFGRIGRFSGRMPVLLHTGGAQAGDTETLDGALPSEKFFNRQRVPPTSIVDAKQSAAHGHDD
jgi:hypothetical protein